MEITHYLAILDMEYVAKNSLQKAALQYFKSIDRKLVEKSQIGKFQKSILHALEKINEKHKRCHPLKIYFDNQTTVKKVDYSIRNAVIVAFSLRACEASEVPILFYKSQSNN